MCWRRARRCWIRRLLFSCIASARGDMLVSGRKLVQGEGSLNEILSRLTDSPYRTVKAVGLHYSAYTCEH